MRRVATVKRRNVNRVVLPATTVRFRFSRLISVNIEFENKKAMSRRAHRFFVLFNERLLFDFDFKRHQQQRFARFEMIETRRQPQNFLRVFGQSVDDRVFFGLLFHHHGRFVVA